MPGPRGKNIAIWRRIPAGDACAECEALRGGEDGGEWVDRENTALHDYARALFEGHCVGWV